ncbi:MAG: hypothetical protein LBP81_01930 [Treponema sp.]|nr:hypothetical protein [Treponema sp.]
MSGLVYYDEKSPVYIDEAYIAAYFGSFDIEGGLRKLIWGKAASIGPLDVINLINLKIARPLIHAALRLAQFSMIESVFVSNFMPVRFAESGRWAPSQFATLCGIST